ncbi:YrzI family small protein [Bacillus mangrovi]|uniref:YrzI family small protein n=1 Tax=Metabacillus mangrovi TaxID=1491830 RepID=A0A7X2S2H7_9BACI|nr:YrzI family small protein [Metabacillus mangrovi]MTH52509.1 YrzI family small protein [Metabacillus mangrovi]
MTIHLLFVTVTFKRNHKTKAEANYDHQVKNLMDDLKNRHLML